MSVAGASMPTLCYNNHPSFKAPSDVNPACIKGASGDALVPMICMTAELTSSYI